MEYYRRAVFLPFTDTCVGQLKERFMLHHAEVHPAPVFLHYDYATEEKRATIYDI